MSINFAAFSGLLRHSMMTFMNFTRNSRMQRRWFSTVAARMGGVLVVPDGK